MAQVLTQLISANEGATQTMAGLFAAPGAWPKFIRPVLRERLPFRAINLPDRPGYDPGLQRHHLLPRQLLSKPCFGALFDRIGRDRLSFDDFRSNGLLLPANDIAALRIGLPLHRGPHRHYNAMVIERVGQVEARWSCGRRHSPRAALNDAIAGLHRLQHGLRRRLLDPGVKRLALNRFDPLGCGVDFSHIDTMVDALWPDQDCALTEPLARGVLDDRDAPTSAGRCAPAAARPSCANLRLALTLKGREQS